MSADLVALIAGIVLSVGALAFVLYPLFFSTGAVRPVIEPRATRDDSAIQALREIEFDRATGKLSESDYAELRATYADRALREIRGATDAAAPVDAVEALVRAYRLTHRECGTCGLRPEPDAVYCSTCGAYLDRQCPRCSAEITESSATFCSSCGVELPQETPMSFRA